MSRVQKMSVQRAHVQADLWVHDDLLRRRESVGVELCIHRHLSLDQGQCDRTELVMAS